MLVAIEQHAPVIVAGGEVVRGALQHRRKQVLGVVEDLECHADAGQQPHRLDVVAVGQQERADQLLGAHDVAIGKQAGRRDHLRRHALQGRDLGGGGGRVGTVADHPVEPLEHAPGRGKGPVHLHRLLVRFDRGLGVLHRDVTVAALLVQAAEVRVVTLEALEGRQRVPEAPRLPLTEREQVQYVPILGYFGLENCRRRDGCAEAPLREEAADPMELAFHGRGASNGRA